MDRVEEKFKELDKEYDKHAKSIIKLLNDSLKGGEFFIFEKFKDVGSGKVISRERRALSKSVLAEWRYEIGFEKTSIEDLKTQSDRLLDILEEEIPMVNFSTENN